VRREVSCFLVEVHVATSYVIFSDRFLTVTDSLYIDLFFLYEGDNSYDWNAISRVLGPFPICVGSLCLILWIFMLNQRGWLFLWLIYDPSLPSLFSIVFWYRFDLFSIVSDNDINAFFGISVINMTYVPYLWRRFFWFDRSPSLGYVLILFPWDTHRCLDMTSPWHPCVSDLYGRELWGLYTTFDGLFSSAIYLLPYYDLDIRRSSTILYSMNTDVRFLPVLSHLVQYFWFYVIQIRHHHFHTPMYFWTFWNWRIGADGSQTLFRRFSWSCSWCCQVSPLPLLDWSV